MNCLPDTGNTSLLVLVFLRPLLNLTKKLVGEAERISVPVQADFELCGSLHSSDEKQLETLCSPSCQSGNGSCYTHLRTGRLSRTIPL